MNPLSFAIRSFGLAWLANALLMRIAAFETSLVVETVMKASYWVVYVLIALPTHLFIRQKVARRPLRSTIAGVLYGAGGLAMILDITSTVVVAIATAADDATAQAVRSTLQTTLQFGQTGAPQTRTHPVSVFMILSTLFAGLACAPALAGIHGRNVSRALGSLLLATLTTLLLFAIVVVGVAIAIR